MKAVSKYAFTLAEVLITLTIIGVIAALTIPNMMQSYKKHQVEVGIKEAYSILSNAIKMSEAEKALFDRMDASDNETMLVCIVDGVVAGNCQVTWSKNIKTKHRAVVAIALLKDYWNLGIGTRFFQEMIRIAESNKDITQMELEFIEGNTRARALYEKMGFRISGVKPNAVRLKDGTMLAEYSMIREVK